MESLLKQHKLLAENSTYGAPGLHDDRCATRKGGKCNCPSAAFNRGIVHDEIKPGETVHEYGLQDTAIPQAIDHTFNRDGRKWRVSSLCDTFVIGTAVDAQLNERGEPSRESDIIKVTL